MLRCLLFLFSIVQASAQTMQSPAMQGMGNTAAAKESVYSVWRNPAGIARLSSAQAGIAFQSHFISSAFYSYGGVATKSIANFGVAGIQYANSQLSGAIASSSVGICYGYSILKKWNVGAGIDRQVVRWKDFETENYENDSEHRFLANVGLQYHGEHFSAGAYYKQLGELVIGVGYRVSDQLHLAADLSKEELQRPDFRAGLRYQVVRNFYLLGGISSNPLQHYAGASVLIRNFRIDFASSFHRDLGFSPQIAMGYALR